LDTNAVTDFASRLRGKRESSSYGQKGEGVSGKKRDRKHLQAQQKIHSRIETMTTAIGHDLPREHSAADRVVERVLADGQQLAGQEGFQLLTSLCCEVEREFHECLQGLNGLDTFEGVRRISGRLWATNPTGREIAVRSVCELAIHRYCDWSEVRLPSREPRPWKVAELGLLARLITLGDLYANALATRRWVGKGATSIVTGPDFHMETIPDARIERLVALRDQRSHSDPNPLATIGAHWRRVAPLDQDRQIILARLFDAGQRTINFPSPDRLVDWDNYVTVEAEIELLSAMSAGLPGFNLRDLHFALDCAATAAQAAWATPPITLVQSGYVLARSLPWDALVEVVERARAGYLPHFQNVTVEATARALDFLDAGITNTDLDVPLAQRPLRRMGNHMLYDALHVHIAGPLLWDLRLPDRNQDQHARAAERAVHAMLAKYGPQPWPSGRKLRSAGAVLTDVDASVTIGDTLIAVDCYASPWSADLDRGVHSATRNRLANLRRKLSQWDRRWSDIAQHHSRLLPPNVRSIVPVVVSTFAEWIDDDSDPKEWLEPEVPRICTAHELEGALSRATNFATHAAAIVV
jgi:hypothetical protein